MTEPQLFVGVDRALFAAAYAERLRRTGIDIGFNSVERCAASLDAVRSLTLDDAYWILRLSLITRHADLATFDSVFESVFDSTLHIEMGWVPRRDRSPAAARGDDGDLLVRVRRLPDDDGSSILGLPWSTPPSAADESDHDDAGDDRLAIPELRPSTESVDMDRPFDLLDEDELERLGDLLESSVTQWPRRRSRRRAPSRSSGPVALRRTMRNAMRTGGDVMSLTHERPRLRPRPVVVLLDVSGSMERHSQTYLHLVRPLALVHRAEVFAFATRLTRITPALRARSCPDVIEHMNDSVGDRFSGTRIAASFHTLLRHRTWSTSVRGAMILICSDGWDTDDPAELERAMKRLSLLAHRIIWVNPRAAADQFEPRTGGMAAALPHCDEFLAGNTGRSMREVIDALSTSTDRR